MNVNKIKVSIPKSVIPGLLADIRNKKFVSFSEDKLGFFIDGYYHNDGNTPEAGELNTGMLYLFSGPVTIEVSVIDDSQKDLDLETETTEQLALRIKAATESKIKE